MRASCKKLWKLLIDKDMAKKVLCLAIMEVVLDEGRVKEKRK